MRYLFGSRTWLSLAYVVLGLPVGIVTFTVVVTGLAVGVGLLPLAATGLLLLFGTAYVAAGVAALERGRAAMLLGKRLPARRHVVAEGASAARRVGNRLTSRGTWKEMAYCVLMLPVGALFYSLVVAVWSVGVAGILLPAYGSALPGGEVSTWVHWPAALELVTGFVIGLLALLAAPSVTRALADAELALARGLLSPSGSEQLAARVSTLQESRARVVDAADAERRRIERDLHDGAQQRLVSLAVNLGLARATLGDLPADARKVIDEAHREAKEAIAELNNLVRGLHPAVLEDRGLDAALSGVAARLPIPVRVGVDLPQRPSPTVEAVAYFVVSEALTNVVKHAQATRADVIVEGIGETLLVIVADDGAGGADLAAAGVGTGLDGLAKRVASVDGTFSCRSPAGGPTVITVELPCAP